jgi:hypothetical protein
MLSEQVFSSCRAPSFFPPIRTFQRFHVPTACPERSEGFKRFFNLQLPKPPTNNICSSSAAFVPQTTNVENPPITHNIPRNQPLKSQELICSSTEDFLIFFHSKIPASVSRPPSPVSPRLSGQGPLLTVRGPFQPSIFNLPTFNRPQLILKKEIQKNEGGTNVKLPFSAANGRPRA